MIQTLTRGSLATALVMVVSTAASAATIFTDTFTNGSTLNPGSYPTPTSASTGYTILSTKAATTGPTLSSGTLRLRLNAATNSGVLETEATTPDATLTNPGDVLGYTVTFVNTNDLLAYSTGTATPSVGSYLFFGLYNKGGSTPITLNNSGLNTTASSPYATGNAANWKGYVSRIGSAIAGTGTSNSQMYTRPLQSGAGTTSANQEVLANGASGGTFNNPTGSNLASTASTLSPLTNGNTYTYQMLVTLNAGGSQTFASSLYSGSSAVGSPLWTQSGTAATPLTTTYNAFAFGYRTASASPSSLNPTMDVTSVTLTIVPEPASIAVISGLGMAALILARGRSRR
ncbi:MAG: hypothetical protein KJS77_00070 [Planctomycetes bacterium]|nr:hypothetical protein [Planctomycetota bacterium]